MKYRFLLCSFSGLISAGLFTYYMDLDPYNFIFRALVGFLFFAVATSKFVIKMWKTW